MRMQLQYVAICELCWKDQDEINHEPDSLRHVRQYLAEGTPCYCCGAPAYPAIRVQRATAPEWQPR